MRLDGKTLNRGVASAEYPLTEGRRSWGQEETSGESPKPGAVGRRRCHGHQGGHGFKVAASKVRLATCGWTCHVECPAGTWLSAARRGGQE